MKEIDAIFLRASADEEIGNAAGNGDALFHGFARRFYLPFLLRFGKIGLQSIAEMRRRGSAKERIALGSFFQEKSIFGQKTGQK